MKSGRFMAICIVLGAFVCIFMGCSRNTGGDTKRPAPAERQRDSVLAKSKLPGARVVGRALAVSDTASARAALADSLTFSR
jgi:hypothetical protein